VVTTGFDLDMTLIDSRPGVAATYQALSEQSGVFIDVDLVITRLGPPLETELAHWAEADQIESLAVRYRELYPQYAPDLIEPMPGACEALAAAAERGPVILVTAKAERNALLHVARLGFDFDTVVGDVWWKAKAEVLSEHDAKVYVGDHVHDMDAARSAGAAGVGVPTGPCSAEELREAGATVVLSSLEHLPDWFSEHVYRLE
jgi:phosphoglycolate phosphatase